MKYQTRRSVKAEVIAIVGAGKGGTAILEMLLKMPGVIARHVCDTNPEAPGMALARKRGIRCHTDLRDVCKDGEVDLIFEVTGSRDVFARIVSSKAENTRVIGSDDARIIFHLLDLQQEVSERLENQNTVLEQRVLERTADLEKANAELEKKIVAYEVLNEKLLQINNEKTKYLMHATHQLKAPFAAIQSYADLILDGYAGELTPMTIDVTRKIKQRCLLLTDAIKDMLELANLKSTVKENIKMEPVPLDAIIASTVKHLAEHASSRAIRVIVAPSEGITVCCNRNQVLILLTNLLENAINYSPEKSSVKIAVRKEPKSTVRISVEDRGIGISEEFQGRIFEEYFRTNEAAEFNQHGTGLGLAIVKEIAQIHGTAVEVESAPGKGSTFSFRLRTVRKPPVRAALA